MTCETTRYPDFLNCHLCVYMQLLDPWWGGGLVTKLCPSLVTPWTVACQAPLSIGFSRQEYGGGLPFPSPGDLPDPGIEPRSPALQEDSLLTETPGKPLGPLYRQISDLAKVFFFKELLV